MKVLVITDNVLQYERMLALVNARKRATDFTFRHSKNSPVSEHPDFKGREAHIDVKVQCHYILANYSLVISMHCLQFFPYELVTSMRCVNIHPGYNPLNRGWYPQVFALAKGLEVGATIHEMDEKLDNGPIICRSFVAQVAWDTSFSLYHRILEKEMELLGEHFDAIITGEYETISPEKRGVIYSKEDFRKLSVIDLSERGTFQDFYNRLRALSHGNFKNAYFHDPESQKKIYLKIETEVSE